MFCLNFVVRPYYPIKHIHYSGQDNQQVAIINGQLNAQYAATLEFQQAENNSTDENCDEELVVKDDVVFMNNQLSLFYSLSVTKI